MHNGRRMIVWVLAALIPAGMAAQAPSSERAGVAGDRAAAAAPIRTDHAVGYYDSTLQRVVLIGGAGDPKDGERDRVWSWSGTQWDLEADAGPPGRVNAAAAYDASTRRGVVVGGSRKSADGARWDVVGDSWRGDRRGWQRLTDIVPRDHQSLVSEGDGRILMYGGIGADRSAGWPDDTSVLQGDTWTRVATAGPSARGRTALAYDARRRRVVLFGGASAPAGPDQSQTFFGDTWTWDGRRWQRLAATGPRGRYAHAMVFDERAGVVLLYGGAGAHRNAPLSDMWQWDGAAWTEIALSGSTPGHRYQPVMVYDRARDRTILHGGIGGASDTWEWDGARWRQVAP